MQEDNGTWGTVLFNIILVGVIGVLIYFFATGQNVLDVLHISQFLNRNKDHILTYIPDDSSEGTYEFTIDKDMDITAEIIKDCDDCDTSDEAEEEYDDEEYDEDYYDEDGERVYGDEVTDGSENNGINQSKNYIITFSEETKKKLKDTYIPKIFGGSIEKKVEGFSDDEYTQNLIDAILSNDESLIQ